MKLVVKDELRDSTIWDKFTHRETDIVIASCFKSGTTLTQQIVNLLVNGNSDFHGFKSLHGLSPWVEVTLEPYFDSIEAKLNHIENLPSPRFFKSHLTFEALPYYPEWKYIYLVRDGRDVALSLYNGELASDPVWQMEVEKTFPEFWDRWLEKGLHWDFWEHLNSWWQVRHLPNVLLVHYSNLINDKLNEIERIANFLNIKIDAAQKDVILHQSSLTYMKENWEKFQPPGFLPKNFFRKGKNGVWKELLTPEKIERYEKIISEKLELEYANWVKNGGALPTLLKEIS